MKSRSLPYVMALLAAALVLGAVWVIDRLEQERFREANRTSVIHMLSTVRARLEGALNARLFLTRGLVGHVSTRPGIDEREFQSLAKALLTGQSGIRSIELAKNTVATHLYLREGNEKAPDLRLLDLPDQRLAFQRTLDTRQTVVAGPVDLAQGGAAFVSRIPIYLTPPGRPPASGPYWGLATILIDKDTLLKEAGLFDGSAGLQYALRGKDGLGAQGEVFFGDTALFELNPVILDVHLPNGSWQLAAMPVGGWAAVSPRLSLFRIGGALLAIMAAGLAFFATVSRTRLRERQQRQRLLIEAAQRLTAGLDLPTVLGTIAEAAALVLQGEAGFRLVEGEELVRVGATPGAREKMVRERLRIGESISGLVAATGEAIIVADSTEDPRLIPEHRGRPDRTGAMMCVPIRMGSRVLGVLAIYRERGYRFRQDDLTLAMSLADQTAIAVENARLYGEIRDARDFLHSIAVNSADGIITTDVAGRITYFSPGAEEIFGDRASAMVGQPLADYCRSGLEEAKAEIERLGGDGRIRDYEMAVRAKGGRWVDVSASFSVLRDASGAMSGMLGIMRDNTARKRAEQALRESEVRFRNLAEGSIQGIFIHRDFKPLFVNQAFARILGYDSADELLATKDSIEAHHAPHERVRLRGYMEARLKGEAAPVRYEYDALRKDGSIVTLQNAVRLIDWPGGSAIQSTVVDITEGKQAEEALRESEKRYRILYEDNPSMYFTVDTEGTVVSVNQFGAKQLGYTVEELLGQSVLNIFHPDDRDAVLRQFNGCFENAEQLFRWEFRKVHKDGDVIWVREAARAVRATDGKTLALIACEDITELKRAEESLQQAHDELELRVEERTAMLSNSVALLERQITERQRAEEALRDSEERYRTLVEYSPAAIVVHDLESGRYVDCNQSAIDLFGLDRDRLLEVGPEAVSPRLQPDGTPSEENLRAATSRGLGGDRIEYEYTFVNAAGQEIPCDVRVVRLPVKDRILLRTSIINIADRKRAEEALRASEQRMRLVADALPVMIAYVDRDQRYRFNNVAHEKYFGVPREQIVGQSIKDALGERPYESVRQHVQAALSGRQVSNEVAMSFPAMGRRHMHVVLAPHLTESGSVMGFYVLASDITDQKLVEQELRESEDHFRQLAETTKAIPREADAETWQITYVGPQAVTVLGYPLDQWVEKDFWVAHIHPDDREFAIDFCKQSSSRLKHFEFEYRMVSKDGRIVWIHDIVSVESVDGTPKTLRGFMIDITGRKRAEEALRASEAALRKSHGELHELAGKLLTAQEEERRRLARELHDDLTQRLAVLAIEAGRLEQQLQGAAVPVLERLRHMKEQIVKLSADVHGISRQLHPSILDDLGLVSAMESECANLTQREGIAVKYESHNVPPTLPRDVALCLYRIAQEALWNIAKHAQTTEAYVALVGTDDAITLSVWDDGVGFDPSRIHRKPGLGLASMEERVRLIRGELSVKSEPGRGTEIEVTAPLRRD